MSSVFLRPSAAARVHTSTVTVSVLVPGAENGIDILRTSCRESDLHVEWYSGSGAGGQHRNKHQNSCRITHVPTGAVRKAETRSRESSYREAMQALEGALSELACSQEHAAQNAVRRAQVGSGMRGDKRRTYRFQEDSVVDHITGRRARCSDVMRGEFDRLW